MRKIKKKFVNAFNQTYEVEVLPKEKVLEIVNNLIPEDIISNTWKNHIDSYGRTEARLNLEDGEIEYVNFTQGEGSIDTHYVILYTLPQNVVGNSTWEWEDILYPEEFEKCKELVDSGGAYNMYEAVEKFGIDFDERFGEYLTYFPEDVDLERIKEDIEEIYSRGE